jgi:hypothetical protein
VIEVHSARRWHAIFFRQENLRTQSSNGARNGGDDDFVQAIDNFISREHKNREAFVWKSKRVPADLATDHG